MELHFDSYVLLSIFSSILAIFLSVFVFLRMKTTRLDESRGLVRESENHKDTSDEKDKVLSPVTFRKFTLISVKDISHNTKLLVFRVPNDKPLGLPIGKHINIQAEIDGVKVSRSYTPVSKPNDTGRFELLVKSYENGRMSTYLTNMKINQTISVRGPIGRFKYIPNKHSRIGLIAGGTGITPCLQLIRYVLHGYTSIIDKTNFTLFFQNRTYHDILLKDDLDELVKLYPDRIKLVYFLSNPQGNGLCNFISLSVLLRT